MISRYFDSRRFKTLSEKVISEVEAVFVRVRQYGQHCPSTCLATLLYCKLKPFVGHITRCVTNLSCRKIYCCKLRWRVAKSGLKFYFLQQNFIFVARITTEASTCISVTFEFNAYDWLLAKRQKKNGRLRRQAWSCWSRPQTLAVRNLPYTMTSKAIVVFGTPHMSLQKTSS